MTKKILCVDDEPHILQGYERALRKNFEIYTAVGGAEAISMIEKAGDFAVVVSDMRMPGMDGIQFLRRAREIAPEIVRIVLTGIADQQTAVDAVNEVNIFRFLSKPCPPEILAGALEAGLEQYRLITAEKQLLGETLGSSLQVLIEMLAMVNSTAFSRATHVKRLAASIAKRLNIGDIWEVEVAAMLSQIGCVAVPEEVLLKIAEGKPLEKNDLRLYSNHPQIGRDLIGRIPRMERVSEIIAHQNMRFNDYTQPEPIHEQAPLTIIGSRILKAALDFDRLLDFGQLSARHF
jgi:response regulator RpfG family c-di-GMP phosphodiesterase